MPRPSHHPAWIRRVLPIALAFAAFAVLPASATPRTSAGHRHAPRLAARPAAHGVAGLDAALAAVAARPAPVARPAGAPDGSGGLYTAWVDERDGQQDVYVLRLDATGHAASGWPADGVRATTGIGDEYPLRLMPDGAGGCLLAFRTYRADTAEVMFQRVLGDGTVAWDPAGVYVAWLYDDFHDYAPDGAGGLLVAWLGPATEGAVKVHLQALDATGAARWPLGGTLVRDGSAWSYLPRVVAEPAGGALLTWIDSRNGPLQPYGQRVDAAGAPQWDAAGVPACDPGDDAGGGPFAMCGDGADGALLAWQPSAGSVLVRRIAADGTLPWAASVAIGADMTLGFGCVSDGHGGAILSGFNATFGHTIAQRVDGAGALLWGAGGLALRDLLTTNSGTRVDAVVDASGGAAFTWVENDNHVIAQRVLADGTLRWGASATWVCRVAPGQDQPTLAVDASGDVLVAWTDYRDWVPGVWAQRLDSVGVLLEDAAGIPVHVDPGVEFDPHVVGDGAGGAIVAYMDKRAGGWDVRARRFAANGTTLWTDAAVCRASGVQVLEDATSDGAGGAVFSWTDHRGSTIGHAYVQRVDASGAALWTADGVAVQSDTTEQASGTRVVSDGAGGAIVCWTADGSGSVLQRVDATGAPVWGSGVTTQQTVDEIVADGAGGAYLTTLSSYAVLLQHLGPTGADVWPATTAVDSPDQNLSYAETGLLPDGAGGVYVSFAAWQIDGGLYPGLLVGVQRCGTDGMPLWDRSGVVAVAADHYRGLHQVVSDGVGGVVVGYSQGFGRLFDEQTDLHAQRVDSTGTVKWGAGGAVVCSAPGLQLLDGMVASGDGRTLFTWTDARTGDYQVRVAILDSTGVLVPPPGAALAARGPDPSLPLVVAPKAQYVSVVTTDGAGGLIALWNDSQAGAERYVRGQRISPTLARMWGVVAVTASLASVAAEPGRVTIAWQMSDAIPVQVERRAATGAWQTLASLRPDGVGRVTFQDASVAAGTRYAYRIAYVDGGTSVTSAETWVDVPPAFAFALSGVRPNPAGRDARVSFTLADGAPVRLELFDMAGRRVRSRTLTGLAPGAHAVALDAGDAPAGLYFVRLSQGGRTATTRTVLMR